MSNGNNGDGKKINYQLLEDGTFVIENYNNTRPFSSFFPGIAGLKGIPMWAFYINRDQGIASFGIKNKNYSLMEFYPANSAYALTSTNGFRTLLKIRKNNKTIFYEPFKNTASQHDVEQRMLVRSYEMILEEVNQTMGLKVRVRYFTLPGEPLAALVRIVQFENIGRGELEMEVVDGLPKIIPYWTNEWALKFMSYTAQAFATVTNLENGLPFYRLKVEINDRPEVTELTKGYFYFGLVDGGRKLEKTPVVIDPAIVFGQDLSFQYPHEFLKKDEFRVPSKQQGDNKYPSAFSFFTVKLSPGTVRTLYSMAGHIESEQKLNRYAERAGSAGYFNDKAEENKSIIYDLTHAIHTESGVREFDLYCKQTYLDNLMRGGMPILLPAGGKNHVFYVYSRKHGDLERDYNNFQLSPSYFSQGNGNFRDMNQNKRNDVFFNPKIGDFNVFSFYNLIQLDGYNPLLVKGSSFLFDASSPEGKKILKATVPARHRGAVAKYFEKAFEPGGLLLHFEETNIPLLVSPDEFLSRVLGASRLVHEAEHGEGFWTDHWTYNLDLLESYLAIFPDRERELLLDKREFTFYDNFHVVVPREEKHVDAAGKIRRFDAVIIDTNKAKLLRSRTEDVHVARDRNGKGKIYRTTLLVKMVCLMLNKLATLDPDGIGIEMEADKPSWYDALNGLPGVFGSSVPETFELKRMIRFMLDRLSALGIEAEYPVSLPEEMHRFLSGLDRLLGRAMTPHEFWDRAATLKEAYRRETALGVSGKEVRVTRQELEGFMRKALAKIDAGLRKAVDKKTGLYYTYFSYEARGVKRNGKVSHKGWPCVHVNGFRRKPLPLFLEAEVHCLKTEPDTARVRKLYQAVKESPLYDGNLGMYKVNAPLKAESMDIGRCRVFSPGWLENESIWLHMEYKFLIELLKAGLYDEFFAEFRKAGVCFQDPRVYGRSILENSSFIASSAFPDKDIWGRGFVARLSGSTAEFIEMWLLMTVGPRPFRLNDAGELELGFKPSIPARFFAANNTFSFAFLGKTMVHYHNPRRIDTYDPRARIVRIHVQWNDGSKNTVAGSALVGKAAERIRNQEAKQIEVFFE